MTDAAMWRGDLERVLRWTSVDQGLAARLGGRMDDDRRALLNAVIETRGDIRQLAERLGPSVLEKLRARSREAGRDRTSRALELLGKPLAAAWSAPIGLSAEQVAQQFFERYGARLEGLTGDGTSAATAAKTASEAMQGVAASKDLLEAASNLNAQVDELNAAGAACAHPEGGESWGDRTKALAREGMDSAETVRNLRTTAQNLRERCEAMAKALREWSEAPAVERATKAESMAVRWRAAATVVADMREQVAQFSR
jgi:hypothetical protein